ncbi:MAG: glycosyltransferase [Candidatus Babeliales bacterium]
MSTFSFKKIISQFVLILLSFVTVISLYGYESYRPTRSMRILFVVGSFPVLSETFIINQITKLIDRGHEIFIYSFRKGNFKKIHQDVKKYHLLERTFYGKFPAYARPFDIIYCQFGTQGIKLLRAKKRYKINAKLVTCFRGSDISSYLKRRPRAYHALFDGGGDLFLPVCKFFKQKLIKQKCDPHKIIVHHSAIDCDKFAYKKRSLKAGEQIRILTVGRLVEKKGIKYAIRAIAKLVKKYPHIHYTIVGDGPLKEELALLIQKRKLEDYVTLYGSATHDEIVSILNEAHLFVLPSTDASDGNQEGIPNVLKEAMACGIPVVSTFHAAIPELVENNVSGLLVLQRNSGVLAQKIEYLIMHPEKWESMGQAGRKKIEQEFEINKIVDKLEKLFRNLLKKNRKKFVI